MNQQDTQLLINNLYFSCTNVPNAWHNLPDGAADDGRIVRPKHVEQNKEN